MHSLEVIKARNAGPFAPVPSTPGHFEVSIHDGCIVVERLNHYSVKVRKCSELQVHWTAIDTIAVIPLDQVTGELPLIELWNRQDVPKHVKFEVELLHSQHRRIESTAIAA
jgi:hypothetical protein